MSSDNYLKSILYKYRLPSGFISRRTEIFNTIEPIAKNWANGCLLELKPSGSFQKGTAISGSSDLDLFISLDPNTEGTLQEMYEKLFRYISNSGFNPQKRNASIKIFENGMNVDLIPGKKRSGNTNYHSIWLNRQNTWTQTNIDLQINYVANSNRIDEIKLTKIWRELHGLDFPSFYLELSVIDALYGQRIGDLANNFIIVRRYLCNNLLSSRIQDPSNSNNVVSDVLSDEQKKLISDAAESSLKKPYWNEVVW